jgi:hypothetical protein
MILLTLRAQRLDFDRFESTPEIRSSVADPDPQVFGLLDPDPSIIKKK